MTPEPLWSPSSQRVAEAAITRFRNRVEERGGRTLPTYADLHDWSIARPEAFWREVWSFCGVVGDGPGDAGDLHAMPGARWFPDARLNFAENLLKHGGDADALVFWGEDRVRRRMSRDELRSRVFQVARALRDSGVSPGDRVAAYLSNTPETVVVALATAAIGAVWSSCSPDFGVESVLDRFRPVEPSVLFAADGYVYEGTWHSVEGRVEEIVAGLPSLELVVRVPYHGPGDAGSGDPESEAPRSVGPRGGHPDSRRGPGPSARVPLEEFIQGFDGSPLPPERFPFDHPLYILFSSGTTGPPKCIVHGAGGTLLQHLKEHVLHGDVRPGDRLFYFTTCGWMMWNWLVSGLAAGATLLLYDGSPAAGEGSILFDLADEEGMTHFGTSARFIAELENRGLSPRETHSLETVRTILSTGSPLRPESFDYVYEDIKEDVCLSSISGGTDIVSCFVLGNPTLPVWRGEIQCKGLGMAVAVFDDEGRSVVDEKGELVCTAPFPSMPVGFWNDPGGERYRAAYFE
ncbi:MAG: acetoacetate--CoA ligase, partial [Longimicrobiales bacterium]|nr:acetoacetate--CoA ligase [Longimicrobiales bacterium]